MGFVIYPQMTQIIADDLLPVMPGLTRHPVIYCVAFQATHCFTGFRLSPE
jgi:hypothetical protein